jgi:hypothetical protein
MAGTRGKRRFLTACRFQPIAYTGAMAELIVTYWRDIPSQVTVKAGRKEEKRMLDVRFQEAIDMAAMQGEATDTDSYLADWHRAPAQKVGDDLAAEADKAKADIEAACDIDTLKALIASGGRASKGS